MKKQPTEDEYKKLLHEITVHQFQNKLLTNDLRNTGLELQLANERYTELYDFAQVCLITLSQDGKILELNLCSSQLLGKERARLINSLFGLFVPPDTIPEFNRFLENAFQGKTKETCEVKLETSSGLFKTVQLNGIVNSNGDQCKITMIDLTEQKHAAIEIEKSEEKFRGLFNSMSHGVAQTDMVGRIIECNPAFLEMLGYTIDELKTLTYQQLTPAKWHQLEYDLVKKQMMFFDYSEDFEKEYIRKDGTVFPISIRAWMIRDHNGIPIGMWAIVNDISDRKKSEEELKKKVVELEQFNRLAVGREMKMIELKHKINELSLQQGLAAPYKLDFLKNSKK